MFDGPHGPHFEKVIPTTDNRPTPSRAHPALANLVMHAILCGEYADVRESESRGSSGSAAV